MKRLLLQIALAVLAPLVWADNPHVLLKTTLGDVELELFPEQAPKSVQNFLDYVKRDQYDGTVFHRVIPGFVVQGGGYTTDLHEKPTNGPIRNEANNHLRNVTGTLAMAREMGAHTARAQFFINVNDNTPLDYQSEMTGRSWGYAVFGRVIRGMDVVRQMTAQPTGPVGIPAFGRDVPMTPIVIKRARLMSASEVAPVPVDAPNPFPPPPAAPATPTAEPPTAPANTAPASTEPVQP